MQVRQIELDPTEGDMFATVDETIPPGDCCLANVGDPDNYISCGERMRTRKSGVTVCKIHGEMH